MNKKHYFDDEKSKIIKDWLKDDVKEYEKVKKFKYFKFKYKPIFWLYIIVIVSIVLCLI